jgi:hypothetical protein
MATTTKAALPSGGKPNVVRSPRSQSLSALRRRATTSARYYSSIFAWSAMWRRIASVTLPSQQLHLRDQRALIGAQQLSSEGMLFRRRFRTALVAAAEHDLDHIPVERDLRLDLARVKSWIRLRESRDAAALSRMTWTLVSGLSASANWLGQRPI